MNEKSVTPCTNIKALCILRGLLPGDKASFKYSEGELLFILNAYMTGLEKGLDEANRRIDRQERELAKTQQCELWRFAKPTFAPEQYRNEYARRLIAKK